MKIWFQKEHTLYFCQMLLKIDRFQKIVATWFGPILNIVVNLTVDEIANVIKVT